MFSRGGARLASRRPPELVGFVHAPIVDQGDRTPKHIEQGNDNSVSFGSLREADLPIHEEDSARLGVAVGGH
jgi:hypothetical protein